MSGFLGFSHFYLQRFSTGRARRFWWSVPKLKKLLTAIAVMILSVAAWGQNYPDAEIADRVFSMVNQVRIAEGLPALKADRGINDASTLHVIEFVKDGDIADQYGDEPSLMDRLRMANVRAGAAGEVMLRAPSVEKIPDQLRTSEVVRRVILDPRFTFAGFAAMQNGSWLYVVGNLVQPIEALSNDQVEDLVAQTVQHRRTAMKLPPFKVIPMRELRKDACEMSKKDSLRTRSSDPYLGSNRNTNTGTGSLLRGGVGGGGGYRSLQFTSTDPRVLPDSIQGPAGEPELNALSVGVCFGTSATYPTGTYWVVLLFYNFSSGPRD